jgi:signal transduction histidine kinase
MRVTPDHAGEPKQGAKNSGAMKLQNKIPLYVVAVILVIGGLGSIAILSIQKKASEEQFKETASALTVTILNGLEQDMLRGVQGHIQETLDSLRWQGSVGEVDIISSQNVIWASTDRSAIGTPGTIESREVIENASAQSVVSNPAGGYLSVAVPIPAKDKCLQCHGKVADAPNPQGLLGAIRVDISTAALDESLDKSRDVMILLGGIAFILVTLTLVLLLRRSVLNPLSNLIAAAGRISGGDYSVRLPIQNNQSELGAVALAFNHMANQVEEHTRQLEVANRELERTNRMKSEFLANMSHELRTPLNVIIGFSEVLRDTPPETLSEKERQEFCENIVSSGYHLLELINDVLDLAKVEAGQMQLSLEEFYVATALKEIIATLRPLAAKKKINLDVTVSDRLSSIVADIGKFKQIIYNLVGNAIKFTPAGGQIRLEVGQAGSLVEVKVVDSGSGIPEETLPYIFDPFYRGDKGRSRGEGGSGLGLAIARQLARAQGGDITARNAETGGAEFRFTLPIETRISN